jgi:hypothetical protein
MIVKIILIVVIVCAVPMIYKILKDGTKRKM